MPGRLQSCLLFELTNGYRLRVLAVRVLAFRNGLGACIFPSEVRPARMHEQDLDLARHAAKQDQARTALRHRSVSRIASESKASRQCRPCGALASEHDRIHRTRYLLV